MCDPFSLMAVAAIGSMGVSAVSGARARSEQREAQKKLEAERKQEEARMAAESAAEKLASDGELRTQRKKSYAAGTSMQNARNLMGTTALGAFGPRSFFSARV